MKKCEVCGRTLKNPTYIEMGVGPKCAKKAGITLGRWRENKMKSGEPWERCPKCNRLHRITKEPGCPFCVEAEMPPVREDNQ